MVLHCFDDHVSFDRGFLCWLFSLYISAIISNNEIIFHIVQNLVACEKVQDAFLTLNYFIGKVVYINVKENTICL